MAASIRFDVFNPQTPDAGAVIYISDDAAKWGRLTIRLTNTSTDNSDLKLDPSGKLQIYFEMLTAMDIMQIMLPIGSGTAWVGGLDATSRHLELHPKQTIIIPSQTSVTIELMNVLGKTPRLGKFRFYDDALGIHNFVVQGFVQRPPADAAKQWGLANPPPLVSRTDYQSRGDTIYVTASGKPELANYLLVEFYHQAEGTLPSAGTPKLSISFVTGDGDLALCSEDQLKKVTASIANQAPDGRWKPPAVDTQGEDTVWTVTPADGKRDLFPADGVLTLRFDNIVTNLPADSNAAMYVQYSGLTGYDDGYFVVLLRKIVPVPFLRYFRAKADGKEVGANATIDYASLILEWDVFAADSCLLKADDEPEAKTVALAGSKPLVPRPFQIYTLQPQVGSDTLPGEEVRFHTAPPSAELTPGPDTSDLGPAWVLTLWRCLGTAADNRGQFFDQGSLVADVPLTLKEQLNGVEMLSTGMQTHAARVSFALYSIQRPGGDTDRGGVEVTVRIGPPVMRWNCRGGDHCVLYADELKVAEGLPLTGEYAARANIRYRIECMGAGTGSATATTSAGPRASLEFVIAFGSSPVINWSVAGAGTFEIQGDKPEIVALPADGRFSDSFSGPGNNGWYAFVARTSVPVAVRALRPGFVP